MTKEKRNKIKNITLNYLILILIISGTLLFYILNPKHMYDSHDKIKTVYTRYDVTEQFIIVQTKTDTLCISSYQRGNSSNLTCIKYRNLNTDKLSETEVLNVSCKSFLGGSFSNFYYDDEDNCVYTILPENSSEYHLYKVWDNGKKCLKSNIIFNYELFHELLDPTIVVNNSIFYQSIFSEKTKLNKYEAGFRILIADSEKESLKSIGSGKLDENKFLSKLAKAVSEKLDTKFSNSDIYKIIEFFRRNNYYKKIIYDDPNWKNNGFLSAKIIGKIDANNDGLKDLLIHIAGRRWINDILLCYDLTTKKIIWKRNFANGLQRNIKIIDIDNDSKEEIMFSTNAPCCELPIDWFENINAGFTNRSYFHILSNKGENKIINNEPVNIQSNHGFYRYKYLYLENENKILLGLFSENDNSEKKLHLLDLKTNEIKELDILYNHLIGFYQDKNDIIFLNLFKGKLTKYVLNDKLNIKYKKIKYSNNKYEKLHNNYVEILGDKYFLNKELTLYDEDLNTIEFAKKIIFGNIEIIDNSLYFIEKIDGKSILSKIQFSENNKLNSFFILLMIFEIILILMYYYFRQLLFLPFISGESSYAVLYRIFGSLYFWRIYGKLSFYKFPRNLSRTNNRFFYLLKDLTTDYKEIYNKHSFVIQIRLFQLNTQNELFLVQRIAHDIKNQLHLINLQLSDYEEDEIESNKSEKIIGQIKPTMKEIYKKTILLSGFSKLFELNIRNKDLVMIIENIVMEYSGHSQFSRIVFKPIIESSNVDIDENLFCIAFRNLIDNALKYSEQGSDINIELDLFKTNYLLRITNNGVILDKILTGINEGQFSESNTGSGVGIQISKKIIENFNGSFEIKSEDGFVSVTVRMPVKQVVTRNG